MCSRLGVAKVGAAEVRADLPLSHHAARGLCHLLLVAGLAQQGAGVVAAGVQAPGTSARSAIGHLLHADARRPGTVRPGPARFGAKAVTRVTGLAHRQCGLTCQPTQTPKRATDRDTNL